MGQLRLPRHIHFATEEGEVQRFGQLAAELSILVGVLAAQQVVHVQQRHRSHIPALTQLMHGIGQSRGIRATGYHEQAG